MPSGKVLKDDGYLSAQSFVIDGVYVRVPVQILHKRFEVITPFFFFYCINPARY